jgi:ribosomal protein L11 methyltransferase
MSTPRYPTVHVDVSSADAENVSTLLWEAGATGLEERDASTLDRSADAEVTLVAHFATEEEAIVIAAALSAEHRARVVFIEGDEWRDKWREFFKPTRIGKRIVIRPSWEPFDAQADDVIVTLDPGQAFGTGTHESTRLVLEEIDATVRGGERVLDLGCGSGILSIAALLLGAKSALAIDVDPDAVRVTVENAEMNSVADRLAPTAGTIDDAPGTYDVVLANIQSTILIPIAKELCARVSPGGTLILSGLLAGEGDTIRSAYSALRFVRERASGDWISLAFERPA